MDVMKNDHLLKNFIRSTLIEAAVSIDQASGRLLALNVLDHEKQTTYVLYDPSLIISYDENDLSSLLDKSIVATISVRDPKKGNAWGAREVIASAAQKGFGPLIYDIAMSWEGGLIPDRFKVSSQAKNVWKIYFQRPDIEKKKLDNVDDPDTPPDVDDAIVHEKQANPQLDYAYFMRNDLSTNKLVQNHSLFESELLKRGMQFMKIQRMFDDASANFFDKKFFT